MLKPEDFQSEEEAILAANLKKIDLLTNTGWAVCIGKHEPNGETIAAINEDEDLEDISPAERLRRGLEDVKAGRIHPIDQLFDEEE